MNSFQKKWITALKSNKFKKGRGYLCSNDSYCCLGVACEVLKTPFEIKTEDDDSKVKFFKKQNHYLPRSLQISLGINYIGEFKNPIYINGYFYDNLAELNDDSDLLFNKIGEIIEENFKAKNFKKSSPKKVEV